MLGRWAGDRLRASRKTSGPERQDGIEGTPKGWGLATPAGGPSQERSARGEGGAGVTGGAHSSAYPAPHPAAHRPGDGAGLLRSPQPFRAGTRPLSLQSRVGGRGRPRRAGSTARPEPQPGMLRRGWRTGRRPCSLGREWGVAEGGGRAFGAAAAARAESQAPPCGQGLLPPFSASLPSTSPPPRRCPRQQRQPPAARNSPTQNLTSRSPSEPGARRHPASRGPPQPMGAAVTSLCAQSNYTPVFGHPRGPGQWARAGGGSCRPAPNPLLPHLPGGGARPIGPGPGGVGFGLQARWARADLGLRARRWGGVGVQLPPSGSATRLGWGLEVLLFVLPSWSL